MPDRNHFGDHRIVYADYVKMGPYYAPLTTSLTKSQSPPLVRTLRKLFMIRVSSLVFFFLLYMIWLSHHRSFLTEADLIPFRSSQTSFHCEPYMIYREPGFKAVKQRHHIGKLLQEKKFETGAEVGVQTGRMSQAILNDWPSCKHYKLIDIWAHQKNYVDTANYDQEIQNSIYHMAQDKLRKYSNITKFYRMLSIDAAKKIQNHSLDFIYIDARHDYCGVSEDLNAYWPKLRYGGIMAGDDYLYDNEVPEQDWSVCADGSKETGAVRGAVEDFAQKHGLVISVTYDTPDKWKSWLLQKQTRIECVTKKTK